MKLSFWRNSTKARCSISNLKSFSSHSPRTSARSIASRGGVAMQVSQATDYTAWSHEDLIRRVSQLEAELKKKNALATNLPESEVPTKSWKKHRVERPFDSSKYSTRLIALKLAYLGKNYNGFEHHIGNKTPLPTIEEELWKALFKAKLIFPTPIQGVEEGEVNWEGCEYSKCGRTDKGVSAFGQVIGIRVRSNQPFMERRNGIISENDREGPVVSFTEPLLDGEHANLEDIEVKEGVSFDPILDELPYPSILNRLLPPDIRILAWCPSPPPNFSARFSCKERRYKYFFTQPAFAPFPQSLDLPRTFGDPAVKTGWLDIDAMRKAARSFLGVHDFRNLCKVDPSKQITNFERCINFADIEEVTDTTGALSFVNDINHALEPQDAYNVGSGDPKVYTFTLHGSAFLWHQVRHMVAVLFLVGQGLESPSIVSKLLDVSQTPRRPMYEMATDSPLVLWDCVFPHEDEPNHPDTLKWIHIGDEPGTALTKYGPAGLIDDIWKEWRTRKIDELLAGSLLGLVAHQGRAIPELTASSSRKQIRSQRVFDGSSRPRLQGTYIPVMSKPLMETVEVINERYAVRKGFESANDLKEQGFRRQNKLVDAKSLDIP